MILSIFLFSCSKEEQVVFKNPYQLLTAWKGTGYGQGTILWTKQINLNNKICVVTGGSRGLGKEMCQAFADNGHEVVLLAPNTLSLIHI